MVIQTNDPRITLAAEGYPLSVNGKIAGGIGVGGETEERAEKSADFTRHCPDYTRIPKRRGFYFKMSL